MQINPGDRCHRVMAKLGCPALQLSVPCLAPPWFRVVWQAVEKALGQAPALLGRKGLSLLKNTRK